MPEKSKPEQFADDAADQAQGGAGSFFSSNAEAFTGETAFAKQPASEGPERKDPNIGATTFDT